MLTSIGAITGRNQVLSLYYQVWVEIARVFTTMCFGSAKYSTERRAILSHD